MANHNELILGFSGIARNLRDGLAGVVEVQSQNTPVGWVRRRIPCLINRIGAMGPETYRSIIKSILTWAFPLQPHCLATGEVGVSGNGGGAKVRPTPPGRLRRIDYTPT
jgi:hypothetical protein